MGDQEGHFQITSVHRNDLEEIGFSTDSVSDQAMNRLADKMADVYCEQGFWIDLEIIADAMGIPKKKKPSGGDQDE